jgi:putative ABC transport system substrate-binding protein
MKRMMYMILMVAVLGMVAGCSPKTDVAQAEASAETTTETVEEKETVRIGVSQIVEHPSLDAIREGIYQGIADGGFILDDNLEIDYLNSQGSMENANTIANEFASKDYDLVVGITTPSAQALFNKVKETPIVYSAVTDPVSAGLEGDNITGVSDMTPVDKQLDLMMELLPETKTVGMIYNSGELNSEIQVNMAREALEARGLTLEVKGITNSNEVSLALDAILDDVDVLYVQKDNTVASAFPVVVKKADEKNVPIIGAVKDYVDQGALATDGPSEYEIGYQTGEMVARILKGESPKDIPAETVIRTKKDYNTETAERYGVEIPTE